MNTRTLLWVLSSFLLFTACSAPGGALRPAVEREELALLLGNPGNATHDAANEDDYLIVLPQYALSYSRSRGIANWVSWHVSDDWLGSVDRQNNFRAYEELPPDWERVNASDYEFNLYGFDRGHICPSADRTLTATDNSSTFYMINIFPQPPNHNQGLWKRLEDYCRRLVDEGNELYLISGNYGAGGTSIKGYRETIANGKVTVPANVWKVILVLPKGEDDLNRIDENTRIIAIDTKNQNNIGGTPWQNYRVSVNEIEAATGLDLFSNLPASLQAVIEAKVDRVSIP